MSQPPKLYEDRVSEGVSVITVFDGFADRWTTTIMGGALDAWSTTYRDEDPVIQHAKAITRAREAVSASHGDA